MCWLIYVTLTVTGSVRWVVQSTSEISPLSYGPSARIMLIVLATGAMVLWPMVRLSQAAPRRSRLNSAVLGDMAIVLVPSWLVILPLRFIAGWPVDVVGAIAAIFGAWVYLLGGVMVLALGGSHSANRASLDEGPGHETADGGEAADERSGSGWHAARGRWAWMIAVLVLVGFGLVLHGVLRAREMTTDAAAPMWLSFLSPLSAIPALTGRGLWGPQNPVGVGQWTVLLGTFAAGLLVWSWAGVRAMKGTDAEAE